MGAIFLIGAVLCVVAVFRFGGWAPFEGIALGWLSCGFAFADGYEGAAAYVALALPVAAIAGWFVRGFRQQGGGCNGEW